MVTTLIILLLAFALVAVTGRPENSGEQLNPCHRELELRRPMTRNFSPQKKSGRKQRQSGFGRGNGGFDRNPNEFGRGENSWGWGQNPFDRWPTEHGRPGWDWPNGGWFGKDRPDHRPGEPFNPWDNSGGFDRPRNPFEPGWDHRRRIRSSDHQFDKNHGRDHNRDGPGHRNELGRDHDWANGRDDQSRDQFSPKCTPTGWYEAMQCQHSHCWCVFPETGYELQGTRVFWERMPVHCPSCLIRQASELPAAGGIASSYVPQCDEHGNFNRLQIHTSTGYSWCVDPRTGEEIPGTRTAPFQNAPPRC